MSIEEKLRYWNNFKSGRIRDSYWIYMKSRTHMKKRLATGLETAKSIAYSTDTDGER